MADFKTHITYSSVLGLAYGGIGYYVFHVPPAHCLIAGSLCSVAGMLPDLDSNSGIPQREMLSFVSVIVPMLMLDRFEAMGLTTEHMVFLAGVMYAIIRFGIGGLFKRYTKHRGMWHSIPAAIVAGLATFMVCLSSDFEIRIFKAWAVVLGFITHLVLDEVYAVNWQGKLPRIKKSFGTALKFYGKNRWANFATYAKLFVLVAMIASDDYVMDCLCEHPVEAPQSATDWIRNLFIHDHDHETFLR
jgi:membrane-bound metal-dependent hydrolase YbcI (DUF457 family)